MDSLAERVGRIGLSPTRGTRRSPRVDLLADLQRRIANMTAQDIKDWMQGTYKDEDSRYVFWNFENVLPGKSGTVEFCGGRAMRGLNGTRWVIAFDVGFIDMLLTEVRIARSLFSCLDLAAIIYNKG